MSNAKVDLNAKGMTDYGDRTPFIPFGDGKYKARLRKIYFHDGFKAGSCYRSKVLILSSNRSDVKEGQEYALQFKLDGKDPSQKSARARQLRAYVAACFDADPADQGFDGNGALANLCELSTADALAKDADTTFEVEIVCRDMPVQKDGKPVLKNDGTPQMVTNQFYNPIK